MREAMLWEPVGDGRVRCRLCPHQCLIPEGGRGICAVRINRDGALSTQVYGRLSARTVDPVEKKPLYHFLPGADSLSISTVGCNFHCDHCQNYHMSQYPREHHGAVVGEQVTPERLVWQAKASGAPIIAYTYTEPTIFFELAYETGALAHKQGIRNVFVSNGYMSREAADEIIPYLDAINIDLKAFSAETYRKTCGGTLQPVLDTIEHMVAAGVWVEVTTLIIPGRNDSLQELMWMAEFLRGVSPDIPWHLSRFVPAYQLFDRPPTPVRKLREARTAGLEAGLRYVYVGNIPGEGEDTVCPHCGGLLVRRYGFEVEEIRLSEGQCPDCQEPIAGVWE
ncbi:MAG: AmmeMemoRadiSam system radical SAM enzyme [Candidatus Bipolaricaulota bacterium]